MDNLNEFNRWVEINAPYCYNNMKHLNDKEFDFLMERYTWFEISETILNLENYKKRDRYLCLFRTLYNWLRHRREWELLKQ